MSSSFGRFRLICVAIISLGLLFMALLAGRMQIQHFEALWDQRDWVFVEARITSVERVDYKEMRIGVAYEVDGVAYEGKVGWLNREGLRRPHIGEKRHVPPEGPAFNNWDTNEGPYRHFEKLREAGTPIEIFVDPKDPERANLIKRPLLERLLLLPIALLLVVAGGFGLRYAFGGLVRTQPGADESTGAKERSAKGLGCTFFWVALVVALYAWGYLRSA